MIYLEVSKPDPEFIKPIVDEIVRAIMESLGLASKFYEAGRIVGMVEGAVLSLLIVILLGWVLGKKK